MESRELTEKEMELNKINKEETLKLTLTETLRETTRIAGELRVNGKLFEEEHKELAEILKKSSKDFANFNKAINTYLAKA